MDDINAWTHCFVLKGSFSYELQPMEAKFETSGTFGANKVQIVLKQKFLLRETVNICRK